MGQYLDQLMNGINNEFAQCANDGIPAGDIETFISTGSYPLNALLSGSIYKGLPSNKITALAGPEGSGKSFICLSVIKNFLDKDPNAGAVLFETESALSKSLLENFGIDVKRVWVLPVETIQQFRNQCCTVLDNYMKQSKKHPLIFVLDSLGMLSTSKEVDDITSGKDTKDMTRTQLIRGAFRVLTLKLGKAGIPLLVTNHTYQTMDLFSQTEMSGGMGLKYSASSIIYLSKKKEKDASNGHVGNIVHCKLVKGRLTREGSVVDVLIKFDSGLSQWYGMIDLAIQAGIFKKTGAYIEYPSENGTAKAYASKILASPTDYFKDNILAQIDEYCHKKFCYGNDIITNDSEEE